MTVVRYSMALCALSLACASPKKAALEESPDAQAVDPKKQLEEANAALAAASEAIQGAQVAAQTTLSEELDAVARRADALGPGVLALSPERQARAQPALVEVGRRATAAKNAVAALESTADVPRARSKAKAEIAAFGAAVSELEQLLVAPAR